MMLLISKLFFRDWKIERCRMIVDTHTHIFEPEFDADRDEVVKRALEAGVKLMILPNIDEDSVSRLYNTHAQYPECTKMAMGLHPTSVQDAYLSQLQSIEKELSKHEFVAIGEVGMDLYWDKSLQKQQEEALKVQANWAEQLNLPLILHTRDAVLQTLDIVMAVAPNVKGVFHSFTGTEEELDEILKYPNFMVGINGVLTFKKSHLPQFIHKVPTDRLLVETDAPYLAPVPNRGKRNEPAFVVSVVNKIAEIYNLDISNLENMLVENTNRLFALNLSPVLGNNDPK